MSAIFRTILKISRVYHTLKDNMKIGSCSRTIDRFGGRDARIPRLEPLEDRRMLSVLFVDDDATSGGDGMNWATSFDDLQAALDSAAILNADAS